VTQRPPPPRPAPDPSPDLDDLSDTRRVEGASLGHGAEALRFDAVAPSPSESASGRRRSDRTRTQPEPVVRRHVERMASPPPDGGTPGLALGAFSAESGSAMDLVEGALPPPPPASDELAELHDRYAVGDFTGALAIAEAMLEVDPDHKEAGQYARSCRDRLTQMYSARLGPLEQVVTVSVPADQITWLSLDHRAGFLLSLVDGASTLEELLDISGMSRLEALRIMVTLVQQNVVRLS
jgi:hypothetical protein